MAKKTVAAGSTSKAEKFVKTIRMVRSPKTGAYVFKEEIVHIDKVNDYFAQKAK